MEEQAEGVEDGGGGGSVKRLSFCGLTNIMWLSKRAQSDIDNDWTFDSATARRRMDGRLRLEPFFFSILFI